MKLKVCAPSELKELEDILFEDNLSLSTYVRFMDRVKANYLEHTQFEEKIRMETPPFHLILDRLEKPSSKQFLDDINGYFGAYILGRGGLYQTYAKDGKEAVLTYRNFDVSMPEVIALSGKCLTGYIRKVKGWLGCMEMACSESEIRRIGKSRGWKGILGEIMGQEEIGWKTWEHGDGKYFFYRSCGRISLARRIYKVSAVGDEISADLS